MSVSNIWKKDGYVATIVVALLLFTGCATSAGPAATCPEPESQSPDYVIGAGDQLQVFVWRNPELSTSVPVRPDGQISIPLVEDMIAVGKTPTQLARDIEGVLGEYLRSPKVNIVVASQGTSNQIQVVGQVVTPSSLPYRKDIRVMDVVIAVGGPAQFAAGNRAKIIRQYKGDLVECQVRLDDLIKDGDMSQNILMYPGDVLIVPESRF
jgi:polysaccharide export outer membrane protein